MKKSKQSLSVPISRRQFLKNSLAISTVSALSLSFPKILLSTPQSEFKSIALIKGFVDPYGVAVNPDGLIYVTDAGGYCVRVFDQAGRAIQMIGSAGSSGVCFNYPQGVSIDTNGDLYIMDSNNGRILILSPNGKFKNEIGSVGGYPHAFYTPRGIYVSDKIYACNTRNHRLSIYNKNTHQLVGSYGDLGEDPRDLQRGDLNYCFRLPTDLVVTDDGKIYVVDSKHGEIKVLDQNGGFIFKFGRVGSGEGQLNFPEGITLDKSENVYVCDTMNGRIQKFNPQGKFVGLLSQGFKRPTSICIDSQSKFYVVDAELKQVIKFEWTA